SSLKTDRAPPSAEDGARLCAERAGAPAQRVRRLPGVGALNATVLEKTVLVRPDRSLWPIWRLGPRRGHAGPSPPAPAVRAVRTHGVGRAMSDPRLARSTPTRCEPPFWATALAATSRWPWNVSTTLSLAVRRHTAPAAPRQLTLTTAVLPDAERRTTAT